MPLRFLFYVADIYSALTKEAHLDGTPKLELEAVMLNINPGHNKELLSTCKSLHDYSEYPARVRRYSKEMEIEDAWEDGIEETQHFNCKVGGKRRFSPTGRTWEDSGWTESASEKI